MLHAATEHLRNSTVYVASEPALLELQQLCYSDCCKKVQRMGLASFLSNKAPWRLTRASIKCPRKSQSWRTAGSHLLAP